MPERGRRGVKGRAVACDDLLLTPVAHCLRPTVHTVGPGALSHHRSLSFIGRGGERARSTGSLGESTTRRNARS